MFDGPMYSLSTPDFDEYLQALGFTIGERWRRPKLPAWKLRLARWVLWRLGILAVPTPAQLEAIKAEEAAAAGDQKGGLLD